MRERSDETLLRRAHSAQRTITGRKSSCPESLRGTQAPTPAPGLSRRFHRSTVNVIICIVRDDDVRSSLFASLDVLCAKHGPEVPYRDGEKKTSQLEESGQNGSQGGAPWVPLAQGGAPT